MYDLSFKLARKSLFKDGYARTLSNFDVAETKLLLRDEYHEYDPERLFEIAINSKIAYVRRDNGKHVLGAYIVKHMVTKKGIPMTMLAFPPQSNMQLSKKAITSGSVHIGAFGNIRFFIRPTDISKLFVTRAVALEERILASEMQVEDLKERVRLLDEVATSAIRVVQSMQAQLDGLLGMREELSLTTANVIGQKNIIAKLVAIHAKSREMPNKAIMN